MTKIKFAVIITIVLSACNLKNSNRNNLNGFEKSFKEQQVQEFNQYLDSATNIYSNFKYHVAFDGPDNWRYDAGVSEHTIYRTFQPDSSLTFSINVIEQKLNENEKKVDIWDLYQNNKEKMDYPFINSVEEQLNTKVKDYICQKSYIKNNSCLKRRFNYDIKDLNYEYNITIISYQTFINEYTYTFSLNIPTIFYNENSAYFDSFFKNVYFLKDGERLDKLLNSITTK